MTVAGFFRRIMRMAARAASTIITTTAIASTSN
jgi:hypothetical protein